MKQDTSSVFDYNRGEEWSPEAVALRYQTYCHEFAWPHERVLLPQVDPHDAVKRIGPIMDIVNDGIKAGDAACTEIGIDFICDSRSFPFGMTLKSNTARALRKAGLCPRQLDRIRDRVATMLLEGYLPQEYKFYTRLLRRTGLGQYREALLAIVPDRHRMTKYVQYVKLLAVAGC